MTCTSVFKHKPPTSHFSSILFTERQIRGFLIPYLRKSGEKMLEFMKVVKGELGGVLPSYENSDLESHVFGKVADRFAERLTKIAQEFLAEPIYGIEHSVVSDYTDINLQDAFAFIACYDTAVLSKEILDETLNSMGTLLFITRSVKFEANGENMYAYAGVIKED